MSTKIMQQSTSATTPPYVVALGVSTLDIVGLPSTATPFQANGAGAGQVRNKPGGPERNAAENLARLGCRCHLLSVFGNDAAGAELMAATRAAGVELGASRVMANMPTARCLILNSYDGESFYTLYDKLIAEALTPQYLATQQGLLAQAGLILTNTGMSQSALAWLFEQHGRQTIFADTLSAAQAQAIRPYLAQVHTLKTNRHEASLLSGLPFGSREQASKQADWFLAQGVRQVVLSLGAYGLYYSDGQQSGWLGAFPVKVVNVTGAGDALLAGLAYGWLQAMPFSDSVRFGSACAALTVQSTDNTHPQLSPVAVQALLMQFSG